MAGGFATIGNIASTGQAPIASNVAVLDTTTMVWSAVATNGNGRVYDLGIHPTTGRLWAVGAMTLMAPTLTGTGGVGYYVPEYGQWTFAGDPTEFILASDASPVKAITFDSSGRAIIGGSASFSAGVNVLYGLARLNSDNKWHTLGGGVCGGDVEDLVVWNDKLFVAGTFTKVNDVNHDCGAAATDAPGFAVLDLSAGTWDTIGANLSAGAQVWSLTLTDFAARNATSGLSDFLLVAGNFSSIASDSSLMNLAKWDGAAWSSASGGLVAPTGSNGAIFDAFTDGFDLYIGGSFSSAASNLTTTNVARYDGSVWSNLSGGLLCVSSCTSASVHTISAFYSLSSEVVTPLSWGGFNLDKYINWKYWLICLCAVLIAALVLSLLTNCCWKTVSCCKSCCFNSKPREKEVGL
jgi:hypothetical protein